MTYRSYCEDCDWEKTGESPVIAMFNLAVHKKGNGDHDVNMEEIADEKVVLGG